MQGVGKMSNRYNAEKLTFELLNQVWL